MKLSLRNLAMGAALAVSSLAFAQEMPFTVTENYAKKYFAGDDTWGPQVASAEVRTGTGVNGKLYAVNKATQTLYSFDGEGVKAVRSDLPAGLGTSITSDDAGNIIVVTGWAGANSSKHFYLVPADGSDIVDLGATAPFAGLNDNSYAGGRSDNLGRIVGDMLSDDGGIFFVTYEGCTAPGALHIANGAYVEDAFEYSCSPVETPADAQSIAIPMFNRFADQYEADPNYNAYYLIRRGENFQTPYSGEAVVLSRPAAGEETGVYYNGMPGADVINYEGKTYFVMPCMDENVKQYKPGFLIYDEEGNILFRETFADLEVAAAPYANGGTINVRQIEDYLFEIYVFQHNKADNSVITAEYTVEFPHTVVPELPFTVAPEYTKKYFAGDDTWGPQVASAEVRTGTGVNGKLYAVNKATQTLYSFDGEGVKAVRSDLPAGLGTSITSDDAGNIIVVTGWAGANSSKHFYLVPADGSDIVDLGATAPFAGLNDNSYAGGRSDNLGRIVGDMLSDDGGIFFVTYEGCTAPGALHIANGAYVEDAFEYSCSPVETPADAQSIAIPMFNRFADQYEADPNYNAYYLIRRGENFQTPYSGEAVVLSRPAAGEETGVYYNGMPGADVINYEGKTYFVMPCMDENVKQYKPGFLIYDEEGNILFRETFADLEVAAAPYANGGTINVRQIEDYLFEIYVFQHNKADNSIITAKYNVEFPHSVTPVEPKDIYVLGSYNNWAEPTAANADQFVKLTETAAGSNVYTGSVEMAARPSFRFISELAGWEAPQFGAQADDAMVAVALTNNTTYEGSIVAGKGAFNFNGWLGGSMDLTVDLTAMTVKAVATTPIPALAVRSSFDEWGAGVSLTAPEAADAEGKFVYTAEIASLPEGEIKIGQPGSWAINFGGNTDAALENGKAEQAWFDSSNNYKVAAAENVTVTFTLNPDLTQPSELMLNWKEAPVSDLRSAFAYDLKFVGVENGTYTVSYTASAEAAEAYINLYAEGSEEPAASIMLDAPLAGENTATFEATDVPEGKYTWAIVLLNEGEEQPTLVVNKVGDPAITWGRGGIVTITDSEYDSYGYTIVANSRGLGLDVYAPNGELVDTYDGKFPGTAGNSCPLRGDQRFGKAYLASWGDPNSGIYAFDPLAPESGAQQIVEGERIVVGDKIPGIFEYNGVKTVSSTPCVAFVGKGEETMMWTFDEDIWSNQLVAYPIGDAETVTVPASIVCNTETCGWNSSSVLANTAVCIEPATNGFFASQNRANGMDNSTFSFVYVDKTGKFIANSYDLMTAANFELPSCNGAIALSKDEKILAVGSYNGVHFFNVTWTDNVPSLEHFADVNNLTTTKFTQAKFDAGNNLHIAGVNISDYSQQFYAVIALPGENYATTNAKAADLISIESGVENIAVDAADANAVYYNLNGVRVAADELTPGIYVKVVGSTATKVVVK